jgi:hypothetical protein
VACHPLSYGEVLISLLIFVLLRGKMRDLISLISANKVFTALGGIFSAAFLFTVNQWYTSDEQVAAIQVIATNVDAQKKEFELAMKAIEDHNSGLGEAENAAANLAKSIGPSDTEFHNLPATTKRMTKVYADSRRKLLLARSLVSALFFESNALKELQVGLIKDIDDAVQYETNRLELSKAIVSDLGKAGEIAGKLREDADGERVEKEATARAKVYEYLLEAAGREHKDTVRAGNAQLRMYHLRSNLVALAATYMGAFIGGWGVWGLRRRSARMSRAEGTSAIVVAPAGDAPDETDGTG